MAVAQTRTVAIVECAINALFFFVNNVCSCRKLPVNKSRSRHQKARDKTKIRKKKREAKKPRSSAPFPPELFFDLWTSEFMEKPSHAERFCIYCTIPILSVTIIPHIMDDDKPVCGLSVTRCETTNTKQTTKNEPKKSTSQIISYTVNCFKSLLELGSSLLLSLKSF